MSSSTRSSEEMRSLIIATTLDMASYSNSRTHHIVEHFKERFDTVTVMYKPNVTGRSLGERARAAVYSTRVFRKDGVEYVEVNPFLNHAHGLGLSTLGLEGPYERPRSSVKRLLRSVLSFLGSFTEFLTFPSFALAYITRVRRGFDVFIGQSPWECALGLSLRRLGLVKTLVYDDIDYLPGNQVISAFRRWYTRGLERFFMRRADLVVTIGTVLARLREKETGRKVVVVPNGMDYERFREAQYKKPHPPTLIYMGFVWDWSGVDLTIEALERVKTKMPDIRFLILGHTTQLYEKKVADLVREKGLEGSVLYLGNKPYGELKDFLKEADIGMAVFRPVDLLRYAFPLKVVEYMSAGLPVIVTGEGQPAEIVREGGCGEAVNYDAAEVAGAIIRLFSDKERFKRYSGNAARSAREYDWKALMAREYEAVREAYSAGDFKQGALSAKEP